MVIEYDIVTGMRFFFGKNKESDNKTKSFDTRTIETILKVKRNIFKSKWHSINTRNNI